MRFKKKILKNGLRIIAVPLKGNQTVTVLVMVEAGSKYETKNVSGISHFLEHMCFKGTSKRPSALSISHELDAIGAQSNAFTWYEYTGYYAKARKNHFKKILDVVSDIYLNSIFPEPEMKKEKGVIIEEINLDEDRPMRNVHRVLNLLLYGDQPAGWSVLGAKKNIKNMKRDDFLEYRKKHYVASATCVVVAGDIEPGEAFGEIEEKFSDISTSRKKKKEKVIEKQRSPQVAVKYKKTDQSHFVLGFRSINVYDKHNPAVAVLAAILGRGMSSRLFQKLREEMGVCYYVRSYHEAHTDNGIFKIASGVDNRRISEVVAVILKELSKLRKELVPKEELEKAKEYVASGIMMGLESSDSFADFFGEQETLRKKIEKPEEIVKKIKGVTAHQVRRVAQEIFQNKKLNLAVVGPFRDKRSFQKILKLKR